MKVGSTGNVDIQTPTEVNRDGIGTSLDIVYDDAREGDAEHTHAVVSKANELLEYETTVDIREGVQQFITGIVAIRTGTTHSFETRDGV